MEDLIERTSLGRMTIIRFENDQSKANVSTRLVLRRAFEDAGVEFIEDWGVGIRELPVGTTNKKAQKREG